MAGIITFVSGMVPASFFAAGLAVTLHAQPVPGPPPAGAPSPGRTDALQEFSTAFTEVARKTLPAVVSIVSERTAAASAPMLPFENPFDFFFGRPSPSPRNPMPPRREQGLGSGIVISADGLVITNNHVVEDAGKITVKFPDGGEFDAKIVGRDQPSDLAVIRIQKAPGNLVTLPYGNSDSLRIGEWVVAVGAPFGLYQTVTSGIVSAVGRQGTGITTYGNFIQTDAAINPGNSGGPLVDLQGRLIGVNTAIYSQSGGYQGIGFAIPVNLARRVADDLIKSGKVVRGWLGVSIQSLTPAMAEALGLKQTRGALVGDVLPGGPAAKAGLQAGDVILKVDDREIADANALMNTIAQIRPGNTVSLSLLRDGKNLTRKIQIAERKEEAVARGRAPADEGEVSGLGLQAAPLSPQLRRNFAIPQSINQGVVVVGVTPGSRAARAGLEPGDVLLEAGREKLDSVEKLRSVLEKAGKGKAVLLLVSRDGSTFFTTVTAE